MGKTLVVVESPGKINKIQNILGPSYIVVASVGHIIDLDPKTMSVDIENGFKPQYKTILGKKKVIDNIKFNLAKCTNIVIATDEDREGEMIGWSIAYVLKLKDPKRIIFNSITKEELLKAIKSPSKIDYNMVDAQKARRILDRIVGYELCPILRKSIGPGKLSAGRVQSVVVKIIVDREEEIQKFFSIEQSSYFKFKGRFTYGKEVFNAILHDLVDEKSGVLMGGVSKITDKKSSKEFLKLCTKSIFFVHNVFDKQSFRNPQPPFTTSTLQQEASRKLGLSVKRTMNAAQRLYEEGLITYMRTDSTNLSKDAKTQIKKYVLAKFGKEYYRMKDYTAKKKNTQEAHEAIRPTKIDIEDASTKKSKKIGRDEIRLYSLIWKRSVASQMQPAEFTNTTIQIIVSKDKEHFFETVVETLKFPGYLLVYNIKNLNEDDELNEGGSKIKKLPKNKTKLKSTSIVGVEEYKRPPSRYNEPSLVDKLDPKNLNIGRPSTYAAIISKIVDRGYVEVKDIEGEERPSLTIEWKGVGVKIEEKEKVVVIGKENKKFVPTDLGKIVNSFLTTNFPTIMDYKFTATMEKNLDKIADGKRTWVNILTEFYNEFHPNVEKTAKNPPIVEDKFTRILGEDPETGEQIIATMAKYGPVIKKKVGSKYVFAPIKKPLTFKKVTLEDALKIFEYPKDLGKYKNKKVVVKKGKFGLYIVWGKDNISIKEDVDSLEDAVKLIEKDKEEKQKKSLGEFQNDKYVFLILKGPYGPFIRVNPKKRGLKGFNVKLPDKYDKEKLSLEQIEKLISNKYNKPRKQPSKRKK